MTKVYEGNPPLIGKRVDEVPGGLIVVLEPGEYGKDSQGNWQCRPPLSPPKNYVLDNRYEVVEHDDKTITVSPSIHHEGFFHGYLKQGVWTW